MRDYVGSRSECLKILQLQHILLLFDKFNISILVFYIIQVVFFFLFNRCIQIVNME